MSALVVGTLRLRPRRLAPGVQPQPATTPYDLLNRRADAFTVLWATAELRAATLAAIGASVVVGVFSVLFVVLSVGVLGMGASGTGYLFAAFGAGGIAGAVAAGRTIHRVTARRWAMLMLAASGLAVGALAGARTPLLALVLAAAAGCTGAFLEVLSITKVQAAFPRHTATVCGAPRRLEVAPRGR